MTGQLKLFDLQSKPERLKEDLVQVIDPIKLDKDRLGAKLPDLLPEGALLELNKHYETRGIHVGRILSAVNDINPKDRINRDELGKQLGMTKALTKGTINVIRRMGLVDSKTQITPLGKLVLSYSPYMDKFGILWLLHYLLASNAQLVLWSNLFNILLYEQDIVTVGEINESFQQLRGKWSEKSINEKIPHEVNSILKTYTEALFTPLRIIGKEDTGIYQGFWNTGIVPTLIWLSTLLIYRDRYYPGASALEVPLIIRANYSPGRILRQNELAIRRALDELHNTDMLTVETHSGLDQVRFKREVTWLSVIAQYLQREGKT